MLARRVQWGLTVLSILESLCGRTVGWMSSRQTNENRQILVRPLSNTPSESASPETTPLVGSLLRVSKSALDLRTDCSFEPGTPLDLEIPTSDQPAPHVLACVVQSKRDVKSSWTTECWLPLPLRRAELSWLGIKCGVPLKEDRRQSLRWGCRREAYFKEADTAEAEYCPAIVSDISFGGARLVVAGKAPDVGTNVEIVFERIAPMPPICMLSMVCHSKEHADGGATFGCGFVRELAWKELWSVVSPDGASERSHS
jgi:PilZ domain